MMNYTAFEPRRRSFLKCRPAPLPFSSVPLDVYFDPSDFLLVSGCSAGMSYLPVQADPVVPHRLRVGPPQRLPVTVALEQVGLSVDVNVLAVANRDGAYIWHAMDRMIFNGDGTLLVGVTNDSRCVRVWDLRKIREGLKELGLDWDAPPYLPLKPADAQAAPVVPLEVEVIGAEVYSR
jgi:hypothetical protein